jgi:hypothetical protein
MLEDVRGYWESTEKFLWLTRGYWQFYEELIPEKVLTTFENFEGFPGGCLCPLVIWQRVLIILWSGQQRVVDNV